jgi:hypothetical protein
MPSFTPDAYSQTMHLAAKSEPAPSNAVVCDVDGNLALYFLLLSPLCLIQLSGTANDRARVLHRGTVLALPLLSLLIALVTAASKLCGCW